MGKLIDGDDGLPAEDVGAWTKEKHQCLCRYINIKEGEVNETNESTGYEFPIH
jgi:hypothetical protein